MLEFLRHRKAAPAGDATPYTAPAAPAAAIPAAVPEAKASAAGALIPWPGAAGRPAPAPHGSGALAQAGFVRNPIGFRAVRLVAEAAAALPLVLQDATTRYSAHPVLDLIARPNPAQGRAELLESLYGQLLLSGNGYLEAVGEGGLPGELHVLRSTASPWSRRGRLARGLRLLRGLPPPALPGRDICHVESFHPRTTTTACRPSRPRPWPSRSTTAPPAGASRCWRTPPAPRAPSSTTAPAAPR
jgi:hypothetical protein